MGWGAQGCSAQCWHPANQRLVQSWTSDYKTFTKHELIFLLSGQFNSEIPFPATTFANATSLNRHALVAAAGHGPLFMDLTAAWVGGLVTPCV